MNIRNFATFGLFADGEMISCGSIPRMENEAIRIIMRGQAETLRISVYDLKDDTVIEGTPVLAYRKVKDSIIIVNMLLEGDRENDVPPTD